jgi:hypothetical protein
VLSGDNVEMMLWNIVLSFIVGVMGFFLKGRFAELERIGILINRTREEIARDHITRREVRDDLEKIMERLDAGIERLEHKIDELNRAQRN